MNIEYVRICVLKCEQSYEWARKVLSRYRIIIRVYFLFKTRYFMHYLVRLREQKKRDSNCDLLRQYIFWPRPRLPEDAPGVGPKWNRAKSPPQYWFHCPARWWQHFNNECIHKTRTLTKIYTVCTYIHTYIHTLWLQQDRHCLVNRKFRDNFA